MCTNPCTVKNWQNAAWTPSFQAFRSVPAPSAIGEERRERNETRDEKRKDARKEADTPGRSQGTTPDKREAVPAVHLTNTHHETRTPQEDQQPAGDGIIECRNATLHNLKKRNNNTHTAHKAHQHTGEQGCPRTTRRCPSRREHRTQTRRTEEAKRGEGVTQGGVVVVVAVETQPGVSINRFPRGEQYTEGGENREKRNQSRKATGSQGNRGREH